MLVNSCISFNYYHDDFLRMKPGGSKNGAGTGVLKRPARATRVSSGTAACGAL